MQNLQLVQQETPQHHKPQLLRPSNKPQRLKACLVQVIKLLRQLLRQHLLHNKRLRLMQRPKLKRMLLLRLQRLRLMQQLQRLLVMRLH
jgi:hypothetical protein